MKYYNSEDKLSQQLEEYMLETNREQWIRERVEWSKKGRDESYSKWVDKTSGLSNKNDKDRDGKDCCTGMVVGSAVGAAVGGALGISGLLALLGIFILGGGADDVVV